MATYTVKCNHHPRFVIDGWELTSTERAEFDYLDWTAIDAGTDSASFVRYRGDLIDLGDVTRTRPGEELAAMGWHGFNSDSYWSGLAFRYSDDMESVIVARIYVND